MSIRCTFAFTLLAIAVGEISVIGSNPDAVMKHIENAEAGTDVDITCENEGGCAITISYYHCIPHTLGVDGGLGIELVFFGFKPSCSHIIEKDGVQYPTKSLQRELLGKEFLSVKLSKYLRHAAIEIVPLTSTCNLMEHPSHCRRNPRCSWSDDYQLCSQKTKQCPVQQPSCLSLSHEQRAFISV